MQQSPKISRDNTEIQPSFITKINYNRISIGRDLREGDCLQLPKSSDCTDYENLLEEHAITGGVLYAHTIINTYYVWYCVRISMLTIVQQ
jgi:hypothetical protein